MWVLKCVLVFVFVVRRSSDLRGVDGPRTAACGTFELCEHESALAFEVIELARATTVLACCLHFAVISKLRAKRPTPRGLRRSMIGAGLLSNEIASSFSTS